MGLKGINLIERHFDKGVAVLFGVGLLGVVVWQFLADPKIKVGDKEVTIPEAYPRIATEARNTQARMEQSGVDKPSGADPAAQQMDRFEKLLHGPVSPEPELAVALDKPPPAFGGSTAAAGGATPKFAPLELPAPQHPIAASFLATIDAAEIVADREVESVLPKSEPYDLASVTVEAMFDGAALKDKFLVDPDGPGPMAAIPKNWWENAVQILGVELVRQTRLTNASSAGAEWGPEERVEPMPGRQPLPVTPNRISSVVQLLDDARFATNSPVAVRRPDFYKVMFGEKWTPPSERDLAAASSDADIPRLKAELAKERKALETIEDRLRKLPPPLPSTPPPSGPGGGRPPGGTPPPPRPGGPVGPPVVSPGERKSLEKRRDEKKAQIARLEARLRELGEGPAEVPKPDAPALSKAPTEAALLDNPAVRLWVHDVRVQRGHTYRYRVVALVSNPFYGHGAAMQPEQADLAKEPVVRSPASEWSDPVQVEPESFWFITGAGGGDDAISRLQTATAEVFQFRWGYWRRGAVHLEPGDSIDTEIKVPDMSRFTAVAQEDRPPERGGAPEPDRRTPPGPSTPPGGLPPPTTDTSGKKGAPGPGEPIPVTSMPFASEVVLLGVGMAPSAGDSNGRSANEERAYLRDSDGSVTLRSPRDERELAVFKRVSRSADKGERELKPEHEQKPSSGPKPPNPGGDKPKPPRRD